MLFQLNNTGFQIKEGNYLLKISNVATNEINKRVTITFITETGRKINELYCLFNSDGTPNDIASRALSYLCICATNNHDLEAIELTDLIGKYITADLSNDKYQSKDGTEKQTIRVTNKRSTNLTFEAKEETPVAEVDLNDILGI